MSRWKVIKSKSGWWAHEPACYRSVGVWFCVLFQTRCAPCPTFKSAYGYAEAMASADRRKP